jgi:hypothetical protein
MALGGSNIAALPPNWERTSNGQVMQSEKLRDDPERRPGRGQALEYKCSRIRHANAPM